MAKYQRSEVQDPLQNDLDAGGNDLTNVAAAEVDQRNITEENSIEAYGADGNLVGTYAVTDHADMGAAVNQAVADGSMKVVLPPVDQTFSTRITLDTKDFQLVAPGSTYTYDGGDEALLINKAGCFVIGGRWQYSQADGGSGNVGGIRLASNNGSNCNGCRVHPKQLYQFHKGIHVQPGADGGIAYCDFACNGVNSCTYGLYIVPNDRFANSNHISHMRIDGGTATNPVGVYADPTSGFVNAWYFDYLNIEQCDIAVDIDQGTVPGFVANAYFEANTTDVETQEEIYINQLRSKHRAYDIYLGARDVTTFWNIQDGTGSPLARYGDNNPRFTWEFDGSEQLTIERISNGDYKVDCKGNQINAPKNLKQGVSSNPTDPIQSRWNLYVSDGSDGNTAGDFVFIYNDAGTIKTTTLSPS